MRNFNYTARDTSGATKRGSLQAADRNAALHELATRGLVPLSVTEGKAQTTGQNAFKPVHVITIGMALIVVGLAFKVFVLDSKPSRTGRKKGASSKVEIAGTTPRIKKGNPAHNATATTNDKNAAVQVAQAQKNNVTNAPNIETPVISDAATNTLPRKMFSTGVEQIISLIVNTRPGSPVPPLLRLHSKENVMDILNRDIVLYEEDNELTAEKKANVAQAKQMMKEYLEKGGKPEDFLAFFHDELKKAHTEWREAQAQAISLFKGDDKEAALKYVEETNRKFADKGIKPIVNPGTGSINNTTK